MPELEIIEPAVTSSFMPLNKEYELFITKWCDNMGIPKTLDIEHEEIN